MIPFINIHTHFASSDENVLSIQNCAISDGEFQVLGLSEIRNSKSEIAFSVGLHPWFLTKENGENDLAMLTTLLKKPNVLAVGECGLNKLRGDDWDVQMSFFERQIRLAETVQKPVIIHCVRAFNEVIVLKKKLKPTVPLIIHGFNKNETVLAELLKNDFYISIGHAILRGADGFKKTLLSIPLNRLFFETDDKEIPIQSIYEAYAQLAEMDLIDLKSIIYTNFNNHFHTTKG